MERNRAFFLLSLQVLSNRSLGDAAPFLLPRIASKLNERVSERSPELRMGEHARGTAVEAAAAALGPVWESDGTRQALTGLVQYLAFKYGPNAAARAVMEAAALGAGGSSSGSRSSASGSGAQVRRPAPHSHLQ